MALFRYLNDDAFLIFSRKFRFLYEAALLDIYERFFSRGASFPTPQEVVHAIYDLIKRKPDLLAEGDDVGEGLPDLVSKRRRRLKFAGEANEAAETALRVASVAYQKLIQTGWLEEEEYGLRVTVDMPMGASLVMQLLSSLKSDVSQRFGGVVVNVKQSLELAAKLQADSSGKEAVDAAYAVVQAREQATAFLKTLRAILSDLRRIRRTIMESRSMRERVDAYFQEFIGELVLKDFQAIHTFNHPFRFKDHILDLARAISVDPEIMKTIASGYVENGMADIHENGLRTAETDLLSIQEVFDGIGEMFDRIAIFRRQLEQRLRNTVKYAEQGSSGISSRAASLVHRLHKVMDQRPALSEFAWVPLPIEPMRTPWSERHLAQPRQARRALEPMAVPPKIVDPLLVLRKKLKKQYMERIVPDERQLLQWLHDKVPFAVTKEARFLEIEDVDSFIAFDVIRRFTKPGDLPPSIAAAFEIVDDSKGPQHDSDWIKCGNFLIRRRAATAGGMDAE
ncbi:Wadjet anti-phage system protein JetA family protein [Mesorhizobium silamurunense]|uniref:Wadjet anti-phage system protein JetA family protein n=1 Tax=Mesorhizobium silamurunense TaxID=499528 RepID=UPI001783500D|nr:Wadjet anti-phage system protein JetA family protein [Mesorhizobium silamurunense]